MKSNEDLERGLAVWEQKGADGRSWSRASLGPIDGLLYGRGLRERVTFPTIDVRVPDLEEDHPSYMQASVEAVPSDISDRKSRATSRWQEDDDED